MRVVIDSNRVQTDELAAFLSASPSNRAVVTDWLMMEAYKGDTLRSIHRSLGVFARFPRQVVVLKNTGMCMKVAAGPQMANRLVWREHTENFPGFVAEVEAARMGDVLIEESLLWRGRVADERMRDMERGGPAMLAFQEELRGHLTTEDVEAIRGRAVRPRGTLARIVAVAHMVAAMHRADLGLPALVAPGRWAASDFPFRVGVAHACRVLEWIRTGSQASARPERIRNDYVDMMMSVHGTYFNGLMTGDRGLLRLHHLSRTLLRHLGATLPPAYGSPGV